MQSPLDGWLMRWRIQPGSKAQASKAAGKPQLKNSYRLSAIESMVHRRKSLNRWGYIPLAANRCGANASRR